MKTKRCKSARSSLLDAEQLCLVLHFSADLKN